MAEIKISDLSIGDWVRYRDADANVRVSDTYSNGYVFIVGEEDSGISESVNAHHHIEPIPLTPEILEKNGFRKNGEYNEWNIGEWNERPFIGVSLDRQSMRVKYFGNDIFIDNKVVFVHQLQHALRLAGVEKEVEV